MDTEKLIIILSIITIITGIPLVFFISQLSIIPSGSAMSLNGRIVDVEQNGMVTIALMKPKPEVPVVFFEEPKLDVGDEVEVHGRLKDYQGNLELVAEEYEVR